MPNRINSTSDFYRQNQNDIFQDGKNDAGANSAGATVTASLAEGQISTTAEIDGDLRLIDSELEALAQNPTANTLGNSNYSYSQAYFFRWLVRLGQIIGSRLPTLSNGRIPIILESVPLATDAASAANQLAANAILDAIETAVSGAATEDTLEALSDKIAPPGQILIDRLPPQLGVGVAANALSTFDASPAFQILSTPHELGAVFPAGIAATQQQVRIVDLNSLAHRGEISIGVVVTGNPTSPGAGTLNLRWAYSSDTTGTPDSAWANTFVSGVVESLSVDILSIPNQIRRGVVRSIPVARYLVLWLDVPARAAGAQLTVVTRVVQT